MLFFLNKKNEEQGVVLFLVLVVMALMTSALLSLLGVSLSQIRTIAAIGDSVIAFYAADTGIERTLYAIFEDDDMPQNPAHLDKYFFPDTQRTEDCDSADYWVNLAPEIDYRVCVSNEAIQGERVLISTGQFRNTQRSIEIDLRD